MQARAADLVLVDEGDLQAELGGPEGGRIAAGPRPEHDEIEVIGRADSHGQGASGSLGARAVERASMGCAGGWVIVVDGTRAVARGATDGPVARRRGRGRLHGPGRAPTRC